MKARIILFFILILISPQFIDAQKSDYDDLINAINSKEFKFLNRLGGYINEPIINGELSKEATEYIQSNIRLLETANTSIKFKSSYILSTEEFTKIQAKYKTKVTGVAFLGSTKSGSKLKHNGKVGIIDFEYANFGYKGEGNKVIIEPYETLYYTPLFHAIIKKNEQFALHLINLGVKLNTLSKEGYPYLFYMIDSYNPKIALKLIEKGGDVNWVNKKRNKSLLSYVWDKKEYDLVKLLVNNGANINTLNVRYGNALLNEAMEADRLDIVKLLLDNGIKIDVDKNSVYPEQMINIAIHPELQNEEIFSQILKGKNYLQKQLYNSMFSVFFIALLEYIEDNDIRLESPIFQSIINSEYANYSSLNNENFRISNDSIYLKAYALLDLLNLKPHFDEFRSNYYETSSGQGNDWLKNEHISHSSTHKIVYQEIVKKESPLRLSIFLCSIPYKTSEKGFFWTSSCFWLVEAKVKYLEKYNKELINTVVIKYLQSYPKYYKTCSKILLKYNTKEEIISLFKSIETNHKSRKKDKKEAIRYFKQL